MIPFSLFTTKEKKAAKECYDKLRKFLDSNQGIYEFLQEKFRKMLADSAHYEHLKQYLDPDKNFQITIGDDRLGQNKFFINKIFNQERKNQERLDIALHSMTALYALKWNKNQTVTIIPTGEEKFDIMVQQASLSLSAGSDFLYLRPQAARENNKHSDYVLREFERIDKDGKIKVTLPGNDRGQEEENIQDKFDMQDIGMIPLMAISGEEVCKTLLAHGAPIEAIPENMREAALAEQN